MKPIILSSLFFSLCGCVTKLPMEHNPLKIVHSPNPTDQHTSSLMDKPPYENVWFYETTVHNISKRKIKIIWFEAYNEDDDGNWYASNIIGRTLRNDVFTTWYGNKQNKALNNKGWLLPGQSVTCDVNWHWSDSNEAGDFIWAYIAVDRFGNDYYAEERIKSTPIKK